MLLGGSATKKLNRRKREVGVVLGVILNRAIGVAMEVWIWAGSLLGRGNRERMSPEMGASPSWEEMSQ